jgi:16S rRNA (cytosine967-C5)-methyltransferase
MNIRHLAVQALTPVIMNKASLGATLPPLKNIAGTQQGWLQELCFGVCRTYFELNALSKMLLKKPFEEKDQDLHVLLLIGFYQLIYMRTADHAVLYETVDVADVLDKSWVKPVINGTLRHFLRKKETFLEHLDEADVTAYNHPKWLIKSLKKAWPDDWKLILEANNEQAPLSLRVNQMQISREDYLAQLTQNDIGATNLLHSDMGIGLEHAQDVTELPGYSEGLFSVQDEAAQLSAKLLAPTSGMTVLDACAAPGGKTCHLLELMNNQGKVIALDADEKRLVRVTENLERLQLTADIVTAEAQDLDNWWNQQEFDRILLDAPCSATGVIRRHPDIKLLRQKTDIETLAALQSTLLHALWKCLKPGGRLLYATCSVLPIENEEVVSEFLTTQDDAIELPIDASWGRARPHGRQLFPQIQGHDGFYYALLEKKR